MSKTAPTCYYGFSGNPCSEPIIITRDRAAYLLRAARSRSKRNAACIIKRSVYRIRDANLSIILAS